MENAVIKSLKERRSVRSFLDKQVDEEALKIILETATYTPDGRMKFIYLKDEIGGFGVHLVHPLTFHKHFYH